METSSCHLPNLQMTCGFTNYTNGCHTSNTLQELMPRILSRSNPEITPMIGNQVGGENS